MGEVRIHWILGKGRVSSSDIETATRHEHFVNVLLNTLGKPRRGRKIKGGGRKGGKDTAGAQGVVVKRLTRRMLD